MRTVLALVLLAATLDAFAQSGARARPPGTAPLDEPPPPPPMVQSDPALEPQGQVTVRTEGEQTVQEYRMNGKVYMQRVTPKHGRPYVLVDNRGDGTFSKQDNTLDIGNRVPQWVLLEF